MSAPLGFEKLVSPTWPIVNIEALKAKGRHMFVGGPFGSNLTSKDYVSMPGVPVIRGTNLGGHDSRFVEDHFAYVSEQKSVELSQNSATRGDLIFTQRGTLGQVALIPRESKFEQYIISQSQMRLTVDKQRVDPKYVYHYFRSPISRAVLKSHVQATGVPHINLGILKQFPIPLPPLSEQTRIAGILDKADSIRRKRQQAIGLTEQFLRSTFLEMFGDPVTNPKGWPKEKLESLCLVRRGGSPRPIANYVGGTIPWIKIGDGTKGNDTYITATKEHITEAGLSKTVLLHPGALIFANCGVSLGFARILKISGCIHDGWLSFSDLDQSRLSQIFLLKSLNQITKYFQSIAPEGTQPNLTTSIMKTYELPLPPIALQQAFASIVAEHTKAHESQITAASESDNLFNSIVQRAFRGEL